MWWCPTLRGQSLCGTWPSQASLYYLTTRVNGNHAVQLFSVWIQWRIQVWWRTYYYFHDRLAWDFSVGQLSSKVLKSSQLVSFVFFFPLNLKRVIEIIKVPFSLVKDICLAEVALSLLLSGDVSLPDMKPGSLSLSVRALMAELHEGLFLGPLLLPPSPQKSVQSPPGKQTHNIVSDLSKRL